MLVFCFFFLSSSEFPALVFFRFLVDPELLEQLLLFVFLLVDVLLVVEEFPEGMVTLPPLVGTVVVAALLLVFSLFLLVGMSVCTGSTTCGGELNCGTLFNSDPPPTNGWLMAATAVGTEN